MALHWDVLTFNITNNAALPVNVSNVPNLDHGEWSTSPVSAGPKTTTSPSFVVQSVNAAEIAPVGSVSYGMADGTTLNVNFSMQFPVVQVSTLTASLGGARAGSYGVALVSSWETWHGQGTRWTVTLTVTASPGPSSAECSYTR
jgi:hypothetical protein